MDFNVYLGCCKWNKKLKQRKNKGLKCLKDKLSWINLTIRGLKLWQSDPISFSLPYSQIADLTKWPENRAQSSIIWYVNACWPVNSVIVGLLSMILWFLRFKVLKEHGQKTIHSCCCIRYVLIERMIGHRIRMCPLTIVSFLRQSHCPYYTSLQFKYDVLLHIFISYKNDICVQ